MLPANGNLGHFRILRSLGRGGQAEVFLAEDRSLGRRVALKVLSPGIGLRRDAVLRFRREAEAASRLDHPGICSVHEAGDADGIHYISMRYVEGETLAARIARARQRGMASFSTPAFPPVSGKPDPGLTTTTPRFLPGRREILEVAEIFEKVSVALHAAHEAGLTHRDIKPGNIIVSPGGEPVILDFGMARLEEVETAPLTRTGESLGTPAYMSPEQLQVGALTDRRIDIYSLGVALYECLTLRRPFESPTREGLYMAILAGEALPARRVNPAIPPDLDVVIATAMERDPARRYDSALVVAQELRRVRCLEPIRARPAGATVKLRRWTQRNPALAGTITASFLALAAGLAVSLALLGRVVEERDDRDRALREKDEALMAMRAERDAKSRALAEKAVALGDKMRALTRVEGSALLALSRSQVQDLPGMALALALEGARKAPGEIADDTLLEALGACREIRTLQLAGAGGVPQAVFSPDGQRVAAATWYRDGLIFDAGTGHILAILKGHGLPLRGAEFSPDGRWVVTGSDDGTAKVWDATTGTDLLTLRGHGDCVSSAGFDPAGRRIVTSSWDGTARVWDAATGKEVLVLRGHEGQVHSAAFDPSGGRIATASEDGTARIWDASTGAVLVVLAGHRDQVHRAAFSPDGRLLVTASADLTARTWDAATGSSILDLVGHEYLVRWAAFSPDGKRIVTASLDLTARLWDAATGRQLEVLRGHTSGLDCAVFSPDGTTVLSGSQDGTARLWDIVRPRDYMVVGASQYTFVELGPSGKRIVTLCSYGKKRRFDVWDASDGSAVGSVRTDGRPFLCAALSPEEERIVTGSEDGSGTIWEVSTGQILRILRPAGNPIRLTDWSADRSSILTVADREPVRIWDPAGGEIASFPAVGVASARFAPDGKTVLLAFADGTAAIRDVMTGREIVAFRRHAAPVRSARFGLGGRLVITAGGDGTARVWDAATGAAVGCLDGHEGAVVDADLSPDGRKAVTCCADRMVRIWDVATESVTFLRTRGLVRSVRFCPDGRRVLTCNPEKSAYVWCIDPLGTASERRPHELTPWEMTRFAIGTDAERKEVEAAWDLAEARKGLEAFDRMCAADPSNLHARLGYYTSMLDLFGGYQCPPPRLAAEMVEVARAAAERVGRRPHKYIGFLGCALHLAGRETEAALTLEESLRCSGGMDGDHRAVLEIARNALAPYLVSCASVDAAVGDLEAEVLICNGFPILRLPGTGEPPSGWTEPDHDDSFWHETPILSVPAPSCLRKTFEVDAAREVTRCSLTLWAGTRLGAWLNGRALPVPEDIPPNPAKDGLARLDLDLDPGLLRPGRNVLALRVDPTRATGILVDCRLEAPLAVAPGPGRAALEAFRAVASRPEAAGHLAYFEARLLDREGAAAEALSRYRVAVSLDRCCGEPVLRLARILMESGDLLEAEGLLEAALGGPLADRRDLWELWARIELGSLGRSAAETFVRLPGEAESVAPGSPPPSTILPGFGRPLSSPRADHVWLLGELAAGRPVRLNCGGEEYRSPAGEIWGPDRFFCSGYLAFGEVDMRYAAPYAGDVAGTDDAPLYRAQRWRPEYRIPLPRGGWRVTLHFAGTMFREPGQQVFDVRIEGKKVLDAQAPDRNGYASSDVRSFDVDVEDGVLDIEFVRRSRHWPCVSAIEIAPADSR